MKVLLIHRSWRERLSPLMILERRLQRAGHHPLQFGYFAFAESFDHIVERLELQCQTLANQGPYAVVAHSLGGHTDPRRPGVESRAVAPFKWSCWGLQISLLAWPP